MENITECAECLEDDEVSPAIFYFAKYTTTYLQPVICIVGFLGNLTAFCVFLSKPMRNISSNLYLAALSGSSYGFNVVLFCQWMEFLQIRIMHVQGFCQIIVYLGYIFSFMSVWLIVCITVENYMVTFHLSKAVMFCTVFRARLVIGCLAGYSILLYSGQFWTTRVIEVYENYTLCTEVNDYAKLNRIYTFWDTITTMVLPITITSVLIVAILVKNLWLANGNGRDNTIYRRLSKKQRGLVRITRVLLAISLTFVILSGPTHVNKLRHLIQVELGDGQYRTTLSDRILQQIFQMVYYLSSCLNIIYYSIWSYNFRAQLRRMMCWKRLTNNRRARNHELLSYQQRQRRSEKSTQETEKIVKL